MKFYSIRIYFFFNCIFQTLLFKHVNKHGFHRIHLQSQTKLMLNRSHLQAIFSFQQCLQAAKGLSSGLLNLDFHYYYTCRSFERTKWFLIIITRLKATLKTICHSLFLYNSTPCSFTTFKFGTYLFTVFYPIYLPCLSKKKLQ